jgi:hypothetical protein
MLNSKLKSILDEIGPEDMIVHPNLSKPYVVSSVHRGNDFTEIRTLDFSIKFKYSELLFCEIHFPGSTVVSRFVTDKFVFYKTFGIEHIRDSKIEKIFENE